VLLQILTQFNKFSDDNEMIGGRRDTNPVVGESGSTKPDGFEEQTLKFVLIVSSASLLDTGYVSLHPKSPEEPQLFRPSKLDCHVLLKTVSHWQQRGPERAVLLAHACPGFAGKGTAQPYLIPYAGHSTASGGGDNGANSGTGVGDAETVRDEDDEENEEDPRARLLQLAVGRMDRRQGPQYNRIAGEVPISSEDDYIPDGDTVVDKIVGFSSQYDVASLSAQRSYWDIVLHPITPVAYAFAPNSAELVRQRREFSEIECEYVSEPKAIIPVTTGPVVGRVTNSSAIVLLETAIDCQLQLVLVDQITGMEHRSVVLAKAHRPAIFTFNALFGNRSYDIVIGGQARRQVGTGTELLSDDRDGSSGMIWGTITTSRSVGPAGVGARGLGSEFPFHEEREERRISLQMRGQVLGRDLPGGGADSTTDKIGHRRLQTCLLAVGSSCPSTRRLLTTDLEDLESNLFDKNESGRGTVSVLANDRATMLEGFQLSRTMADALSRPQPHTHIELVVHCGVGIDYRGGHARAAMALLAQAEALLAQSTTALLVPRQIHETYALQKSFFSDIADSASVGMASRTCEVDKLITAAENELRAAYRLHWGSSSHCLLQHGSHIFVSSPMLDLLNAFNAPSLRALAADTSRFCVQHLLRIATTLSEEYQANLWQPEGDISDIAATQLQRPSQLHALGPSQQHHHTYHHQHQYYQRSIHQISAGRALVFTLQVRNLFEQNHSSKCGIFDNLVPDEQMELLHHILAHSSDLYPLVMTLVLCSPLPLIGCDTITRDFSMLGAPSPGYSSFEAVRILDLLAAWMSEDNNREVLVITGGVSIGFHSVIEINEGTGAPRTQSPVPFGETAQGAAGAEPGQRKITQICCGSLVGVKGNFMPPEETKLHAPNRTFHFKLRSVHQRAHVAVVDLQTNPDGSHRRINNRVCELPQYAEYVVNSNVSHGHLISGMDGSGAAGASVDDVDILQYVWNAVIEALGKPVVRPRKVASTTTEADAATGAESLDHFAVTGGMLGGRPVSGRRSARSDEATEVQVISRSVRASCKRCAHIVGRCHKLFNESFSFGMPSHGYQLQQTFICVTQWILNRMPAECKAVCAQPSSFVICKLWQQRCTEFGTTSAGIGAVGAHDSAKVEGVAPRRKSAELAPQLPAPPAQPTQPTPSTQKADPNTVKLVPANIALVSSDVTPWGKEGEEPSHENDGPINAPQDADEGAVAAKKLDSKQQRHSLNQPHSHHHHHHHHHHSQAPLLSQTSADKGIAATMCSDPAYFQSFISQLFEAQALLENISCSNGFTDGWQ
jgi:hypothetical protein